MSARLPSPVLKLRLLYWESASIKILFQILRLTQAQVLETGVAENSSPCLQYSTNGSGVTRFFENQICR